MSHKIAKLAYWLIPVVCFCLCPVTLIAQAAAPENGAPQEKAAPEKQEKKTTKSAHMKTVTGCLQKGDEAGEFSITAEDGKIYGLRSTSVKLDQHLGHQVTVTGSTAHESKAEKAEEKKEGAMEKASSKAEYADLDVTSLKMVSETCSK